MSVQLVVQRTPTYAATPATALFFSPFPFRADAISAFIYLHSKNDSYMNLIYSVCSYTYREEAGHASKTVLISTNAFSILEDKKRALPSPFSSSDVTQTTNRSLEETYPIPKPSGTAGPNPDEHRIFDESELVRKRI